MILRRFEARGSALALPGLVLVALVTAGCGAVASAATPVSPSPGVISGAVGGGGSAGQPILPITGTTATGGAVGPSIAYPYPIYPGAQGLAPDHTIVVTGTGQAPVQPDLSDRASAQQTALADALADAKAQATMVASATGVTMSGVLSVSVSSSQNFFGPVPLAGGGTVPAPVKGAPTPVPPYPIFQELVVTVTVAYRIS